MSGASQISTISRLLLIWLGVVLIGPQKGAFAQEIAPLPLLEQCQVGQSTPLPAALIEQLGKSAGDEATLVDLIDRVGKACDPGAIDPLVGMLGNQSTKVRIAAIEALGRSGNQEAIDPLINILLTESDEVRPAIVRSMLSLQFQKARAAALNMFTHPLSNPVKGAADMRVRASAILTFNQLNNTMYNQKAIGFLHTFMQSNDPEVVRIATETMTRLPQTRNGTREMIGLVKNNHIPMIRIWMCEWLGKLKIVEARSALEQVAAHDPNLTARAVATEALKKIGP